MTQTVDRGCTTCALWDRSGDAAQQRRQDSGAVGARCLWTSAERYPDAVEEKNRPVAYRFMWRGAGAACHCWKPDDREREA